MARCRTGLSDMTTKGRAFLGVRSRHADARTAAGCDAPDSDRRLGHRIRCPADRPNTDSSLPGSTVGRTDAMDDVYAAVKPGRPSHLQGRLKVRSPRVPTVVPTTPIAIFAQPFDSGTSQ